MGNNNPVLGYATNIPPAGTALAEATQDPTVTATITVAWLQFLNVLQTRTGGGTGAPQWFPQSVADAGTTQGTAEGLIPGVAFVDAQGGAGVQLPAMQAGQFMLVFNTSNANATEVYPPAGLGAQINVLGADAPYSLAHGTMQFFIFESSTQIHTITLG
jgi:hypothetical protein